MQITKPLTIYLPDTRGVVLSRYGRGNLKIGPSVYTYSRLPGRPDRWALGTRSSIPITAETEIHSHAEASWRGTCPGSTSGCERICYSARPVAEMGPVATMWLGNSLRSDVPPIPEDCRLLRIHVSGDFDTVEYIENWIVRLEEHAARLPVHALEPFKAWAYTRSWRVPHLLPALERLRALPHVQLFASMDKSHADEPPVGWRRAWIDGDQRAGTPLTIRAHTELAQAFIDDFECLRTADGTKSLICPEETKAVSTCEECGFCFAGPRNDVTFLEH